MTLPFMAMLGPCDLLIMYQVLHHECAVECAGLSSEPLFFCIETAKFGLFFKLKTILGI